MIIAVQCTTHMYTIIARGSKFLRIAALKEFVEKILQICVTAQWLKF